MTGIYDTYWNHKSQAKEMAERAPPKGNGKWNVGVKIITIGNSSRPCLIRIPEDRNYIGENDYLYDLEAI